MTSFQDRPGSIAITVSTAARLLSVSRATLYRVAQDDKTFPTIRRIGKRASRIVLVELEEWLSKQQGGGNA